MVLNLMLTFSLCALGLLAYLIRDIQKRGQRQEAVKRHGCEPLREPDPNKWFPPFGLDKLGKVQRAERTASYPLLMLGDHELFGDTYAQWGGSLYTIITRDPRNIREMLSRRFNDYEIGEGRHGCVRPLLGDGIFTQDGARWERSRKLLAPMIQRPTLPDLELIERHFQRLLKRIYSNSSLIEQGDGCIDLKDPLFDLSFDMITEFLLGDEKSLEEEDRASNWAHDFAKQFKVAFRWIAKRERWKIFYWVVDSFEFRRACRNAREILARAVERSTRAMQDHHSSKESYIALEPLLQDRQNVPLVRDQVLNLLLAGRDTSGSLLCWTFYALAREPEIVNLLKAEMESVLSSHGAKPTKSDINRLTKLDMFMTEVLRTFPPVPINGRFSINDTILPAGGGDSGESPVFVPKGTLIAFSTFAAQRSTASYGDDANAFRIDRWRDDIKERRMIDWTYHPFIGGPRKCLGERFAILQAKYLTCRLLQHFDSIVAVDKDGREIQPSSDGAWVADVRYHVGLTMSPEEGVFVRLVEVGG